MLQQEVRRLPPASVMHLREGTDHFSNKTKLRPQAQGNSTYFNSRRETEAAGLNNLHALTTIEY
jgi:hypothetical protein